MDADLRDLVKWASTTTVSDRRTVGSRTADVEVSQEGRVRHVRMTGPDGEPSEVYATHAGAIRPTSYPAELPFLPGTAATMRHGFVAWTVDAPMPPVESAESLPGDSELNAILEFHRAAGWEVGSEGGSSPTERVYRLERGDESRTVHQVSWMGSTALMLVI